MADRPGSHRLERWVHQTLLAGLILSGLLLTTGLALVLLRGHAIAPVRLPDHDNQGWGSSLRAGLAGERRFAAVALAVLGLLGVGIALGVG